LALNEIAIDLIHFKMFFWKALYPINIVVKTYFISFSEQVTVVTIVNGKAFRLSEKFAIHEPRGIPSTSELFFVD